MFILLRIVLVYFLLLFFSGCAMLGLGSGPATKIQIIYPPELETVQDLIVANKTEDARLKIDDYLDRSQNIHWFGHAYFLKGFLYEMDNNLNKAAELYHTAVEHASGYDSKVEAKALYNLSFVYEKMGKREMLLITLLDLMKRREYFDLLTGQVEIPARLASVYGAEGKLRETKIFHREARENFKSLVRSSRFRSNREELSKSLYYLGLAVYPERKESFSDKVILLSMGQKYFLSSSEASKSTWATRSKDQLFAQYNFLWQKITNYHASGFPDPLSEKKNRQEMQLLMASDFYDLIHRLRVEEFPLGDVNRNSKAVMDKSAQWLDKIERFAQGLNLGPEMTRDKKIKNKKLVIFVEKKQKPVLLNPESSAKPKKESVDSKSTEPTQLLPPKKVKATGIGSDPNL